MNKKIVLKSKRLFVFTYFFHMILSCVIIYLLRKYNMWHDFRMIVTAFLVLYIFLFTKSFSEKLTIDEDILIYRFFLFFYLEVKAEDIEKAVVKENKFSGEKYYLYLKSGYKIRISSEFYHIRLFLIWINAHDIRRFYE